ncbi:MAG: response regulator transcription factor [Candidatus Melainabacteria bacterium]|nr:response regulator transcription factor [Candidatus Melainabacteria bacterium]
MAKLLVVEDNLDLSENLQEWLRLDNHQVEICHNGVQALELLAYSKYDVIILDVTMPEMDGFTVCRKFRAGGGQTPILFLTGKNSIEEKEEGFERGGDDYLTKPFDFRELSARLRALLRRFPSVESGLLGYLDLELDPKTKQVKRAGEALKLSPKEYQLLEFLLRHPNEIYSATDLLMHVWSSDSTATEQTVRACVKRLREVIDRGDGQSYILNQRGHGYGLNRDIQLPGE